MKKLLVLVLLLLAVIPYSSPAPVYAQDLSQCLHMYGTFSATDWPANVKIAVACKGDNGPAGCTGNYAEIYPGESFNFPNCSCPPFASGCLDIKTDINAMSCTVYGIPLEGPLACGTNGDNIDNSFHVTCPAPPPVCNRYCDTTSGTTCEAGGKTYYPATEKCTTNGVDSYNPLPCGTAPDSGPIRPSCEIAPTPTAVPTPIPTKIPTPIPTKIPTPTTFCPVPAKVLNVHIDCPTCSN